MSLISLAMVAFAVIAGATHNALDKVYGPSVTTAAALAIVGGLIASRRPNHVIGWILLFIAFTQGLVEASSGYAHLYYNYGVHLPFAHTASWLAHWTWIPGLAVALTFLFLLFPDGHLLSRRWRLFAVVSGATLSLGLATIAVSTWSIPGTSLQGSSGPPAGSAAAYAFGIIAVVIPLCSVAALSSLVLRYRRAKADERHQLKWFGFGAVLFLVAAALSFSLTGRLTPLGVALTTFQNIAILGLPIAIGLAVLRYRLYDIDVVISRTLAYGSLAVFITAVYVGIAVGIGALVGGGGKPNLGLSILATAVVAVGFQPVRERVQSVANRLVYGKRATPYEVLSQFSERVAESYATEDVMPRMARVLAEGTGAQRADVWLRTGATWREAAVWPADALRVQAIQVADGMMPPVNGANRLVEVRHQGELLGALGVTKRSGESLTPVEENLLSHLAGQAGLVLKNVGLTSDLHGRLEELRASRQRLVTAQDEERRRLERNLHDGAQQHLVSLKVKLGLVEMLAARDPEKARATLVQLKDDADEALETLRDLARGIYPPLLADKGLGAALESQARKATFPVTVDAVGIGRYSQDVEAAVYFSVLEALQNVQKYAQASQATVRLRDDDGMLRFEIADDGCGFDVATTRKGSGLVNMADRLDALGGHVEVTSTPGDGTRLQGRLPVPAGVAA
ncbi:MAG: sensor histidine kinase [Candidatus Dormibacter sp.]